MMMEENQLKKQLETKAIKINTDISKKKKQIPLDEKARKTNFEHLKRACNMENSWAEELSIYLLLEYS